MSPHAPQRPPDPEGPTRLIYDAQDPLLLLRPALLRVIAGPDRGATCELGARRATVGTAEDNDLVLGDAGVSRRHLEFQVQDRGFWVKDLRSTNGTFYRGARVNDALLVVGAELRLGNTVLRLESAEEQSQRIGRREAFGTLVGAADAMQRIYGVLAAVAPTDVTVLVEGETGTGKELVAEELHRHSPRRDHRLLVVDCGALPAGLIESELFGHEKGAFTGAAEQRSGVFERADGGTVVLDEIGELPLALQTRLLRVLDTRTIRRVGGDLQRRVDVRLIAATNRDLAHEVREGRFRQDLYYRLAVVRIAMPPLRKRREDIPLLARHFLHQLAIVEPERVLNDELLQVLAQRRWPGNVRELRNVIERAVVLADGGEPLSEPRLEEPSAPPPPPQPAPGEVRASDGWLARAMPTELLRRPYATARDLLLGQFDTLYFGKLLEAHGGNISAIAREAGLDRHQTRRLLKKNGLYE